MVIERPLAAEGCTATDAATEGCARDFGADATPPSRKRDRPAAKASTSAAKTRIDRIS
jgi:hypothetical protein